MIVVSDTTPIISLIKANRLDLLEKLYGTVLIPKAVYDELLSNDSYFEEKLQVQEASFLIVEEIKNQESVRVLRCVSGLDAGESEALILYGEKNADVLLMDEHKGRGVAKKMSVCHIGTIGILLLSYDKNLLLAEEVREIIYILLENNIRLSKNLCNKVFEYVGLEDRI